MSEHPIFYDDVLDEFEKNLHGIDYITKRFQKLMFIVKFHRTPLEHKYYKRNPCHDIAHVLAYAQRIKFKCTLILCKDENNFPTNLSFI